MKKSNILCLMIIIILVLALAIMTFLYFNMKEVVKGLHSQIESNQDLISHLNEEIDELNNLEKKQFKISYKQRKDLGINKIIDKDTSDKYDFNICTFGGDVEIIVEDDMVYPFDKALNEEVITADDILNQAEKDSEDGKCKKESYSDGGSIEYNYSTYTIVKFNNLDGNKDLYIAMPSTQGENILTKINDNNKEEAKNS